MSHPSSSPVLAPLRDRAAFLERGLLVTSAISDPDPGRGKCPASKARQAAYCRLHLSDALDDAIADPQDDVRVEMNLREFGDRSSIDPLWPGMYPSPQLRPARRTIRPELPEGCIFHLVATAILPEG